MHVYVFSLILGKVLPHLLKIQNGNYQEINFLILSFPEGNLRKINQNQKTSWDSNSCFTHSIYMKKKGKVNLNLPLSL